MNPESNNAPRLPRARTSMLAALLLLAGLATLTPAAAASFEWAPPCDRYPLQSKVDCLLNELGQEPGCVTTPAGHATCVTAGCEWTATASVGTYTYSRTPWGFEPGQTTCYYTAPHCLLGYWTEYGWSGRDETCVVQSVPTLPSVNACNSPKVGVTVDGTQACVDPSTGSCNTGEAGVVVLGVRACQNVSTGPCPDGKTGVTFLGVQACVFVTDPLIGSCTGAQYGLVILGTPVCAAAAACPSGSYGVVVDGDAECHTVGLCTSDPYGVSVDGWGCVGSPRLCSDGYGVVAGGVQLCFKAGPCAWETGVEVNGHCYDVVVCSGEQAGVRVDGTNGCVQSPVEPCPNGRKGIVVANQELCPVP